MDFYNTSLSQTLEIGGLPILSGNLLRFYARGFDTSDALIAQGCNDQLYGVTKDAPLSVELSLARIP
jgi:hypothetical protein